MMQIDRNFISLFPATLFHSEKPPVSNRLHPRRPPRGKTVPVVLSSTFNLSFQCHNRYNQQSSVTLQFLRDNYADFRATKGYNRTLRQSAYSPAGCDAPYEYYRQPTHLIGRCGVCRRSGSLALRKGAAPGQQRLLRHPAKHHEHQ